jgi:hypothetical protein
MSTTHVPSYRKHRQSGQAIVTLPDGLGGRRDVLLGKYGTKASRMEYARLVAEWEASIRRPPPAPSPRAEVKRGAASTWPCATPTAACPAVRVCRACYGKRGEGSDPALAVRLADLSAASYPKHPPFGPLGQMSQCLSQCFFALSKCSTLGKSCQGCIGTQKRPGSPPLIVSHLVRTLAHSAALLHGASRCC